MRIAVNAASYIKQPSENDKNYYEEFFIQLAASQPKHTFIFIFDKPYQQEKILPENVIRVLVGPEADSPLKWRIWYHIKIPVVLKKHKAGIFISVKFCSLTPKIPQLLISPDLTFFYQPDYVNKKHLNFYKKYTPRFIRKADVIVVHSLFAKNEIIERYKTDVQKIEINYKEAAFHFKPLNYDEKELIKEKYADGNEYFIYTGIVSPQQNLINLLKAFSFFKKRQKSAMQLIIAGNKGPEYETFIESLRLFRFHKEVKILHNLSNDEIGEIIASAYTMLYVPVYETSSVLPLSAMKCEIPVITSSTGAMPEFCGEAALFADPQNFKDIAEKMMLIFKDEKLRKGIIEKGKSQIAKNYVQKKSSNFFEIIENTVKNNPLK
jgi:glycosyltransferase involved in cell wall biosynthesis